MAFLSILWDCVFYYVRALLSTNAIINSTLAFHLPIHYFQFGSTPLLYFSSEQLAYTMLLWASCAKTYTKGLVKCSDRFYVGKCF